MLTGVGQRGSQSLEATPPAQSVSRAPQSALKGEMAIYINKEFTPSMFICHPGLPQDLIISLDNRES